MCEGDRVQYKAFGKVGDTGTVVRVMPVKAVRTGGVRARVRVRWDATKCESVVDDQVLVLVKE